MEANKMFEVAVRNKFRFPFKGVISVEDLWDLSVQQLDGIFKTLKSQGQFPRSGDGLPPGSSGRNCYSRSLPQVAQAEHLFRLLVRTGSQGLPLRRCIR